MNKALVGGCERLTADQTPCSNVPLVARWTHPEHAQGARISATGQRIITQMKVCARCDHTISNVMAKRTRQGRPWTREAL